MAETSKSNTEPKEAPAITSTPAPDPEPAPAPTPAPAPAPALAELPQVDHAQVMAMAMAMAAAQNVRTAPIVPTYGLDDTALTGKPYFISSNGTVVDANGNPVDLKDVDAETKAQAKTVKSTVRGVQFAEEEV